MSISDQLTNNKEKVALRGHQVCTYNVRPASPARVNQGSNMSTKVLVPCVLISPILNTPRSSSGSIAVSWNEDAKFSHPRRTQL